MSKDDRNIALVLYAHLALCLVAYLIAGKGSEYIITIGALPGAIWYVVNLYGWLDMQVQFVKSLIEDLK